MGFNKPYKAIKPMFQTNRWRIFPGDMVYINHGPHARQSGKVLQVIKDKRVPQVVVENVNLRKKKIYTSGTGDEYLVVTMEAPVHYSQVSLLEPVSARSDAAQTNADAASLVGPEDRWVKAKFRYLADGTRVRIGKGNNATGAIIPIPPQADPNSSGQRVAGVKDCKLDEAERATYTQGTEDFSSWLQAASPPLGTAPRGRAPSANATTSGSQGTRQFSSFADQLVSHHKYHQLMQGHQLNGCPSLYTAALFSTRARQHRQRLNTLGQSSLLHSQSVAVQGWLQQARHLAVDVE